MLFEAGGDSPEVFELAEEALDAISVAIEERAEGGHVDAPWHRLDAAPGAAAGEVRAQGVAVIGAVGQQDLVLAEAVEHVAGTSTVMGLAFAQLQHDGQAIGIDERVDLGRQPAPRAPHAPGVRDVPSGGAGRRKTLLLTLPAC